MLIKVISYLYVTRKVFSLLSTFEQNGPMCFVAADESDFSQSWKNMIGVFCQTSCKNVEIKELDQGGTNINYKDTKVASLKWRIVSDPSLEKSEDRAQLLKRQLLNFCSPHPSKKDFFVVWVRKLNPILKGSSIRFAESKSKMLGQSKPSRVFFLKNQNQKEVSDKKRLDFFVGNSLHPGHLGESQQKKKVIIGSKSRKLVNPARLHQKVAQNPVEKNPLFEMTFGQLKGVRNPLEMTFGQSDFKQKNTGDGQHQQTFQPLEEKYKLNPFARQAPEELRRTELEKTTGLNRASSKKHFRPVIASNKKLPSVFKIMEDPKLNKKYHLI